MPGIVVLCADGSERSDRALAAGLAVLAPGLTPVVATVIEEIDPMVVTGTGFAGGTMTPETYERSQEANEQEGRAIVADAAAALGLRDAQTVVLQGQPGPMICRYATEAGAAAIVIGTRGRGGLKRAVLGSVSDHVVRHAPCPVVVMSDPADG